MRLLQKQEAEHSLKRENDELVDQNLTLRSYYGKALERLRGAKDDYSKDKLKKMEEYEAFCRALDEKKAKKLQELAEVSKAVEDRREIYYGLVAKQDSLEDRIYKQDQREKILDLRENFIKEIEEKQNAKLYG